MNKNVPRFHWKARDEGRGGTADRLAIFDGPLGIWVRNDIEAEGDLFVWGTKSAVIATGPHTFRRMYAIESPEVWFEDFGTADMVNGYAMVTIDPIFAQTVNLSETYHVFLTPLGDCGLYVADKSSTSFVVRALGGQSCNLAFDYRIVAKRLGYEDHRLDVPDLPPSAVEGLVSDITR